MRTAFFGLAKVLFRDPLVVDEEISMHELVSEK